MARKGKKRSTRGFQDDQYKQIISKSRPEAEKILRQLGLLAMPLKEVPYSHRLSAQAALRRKGAEPSFDLLPRDLSQFGEKERVAKNLSLLKEKDRVVAYYARPGIQREMHRYALGRYLTVLRNFRPMFSELRSPGDILPLMFHYLKSNRWPSLHGTIVRRNEAGQKICDFVFEPDYKKNWAVAFSAARPIVQLFLRMGLPFFVKFSGNTSPHIIVPGEALASAGKKEIKEHHFREQVYMFVQSRMSKPGLLDGPNWRPEHFLRLAYSMHELGGKVSIPIRPEEFDSFDPDMARIENVRVMEDWWHIPEDAAERGSEFVQQVTKNYPRLVSGTVKLKTEHKWKPPAIPRKLRQVFDAGWYAKVLASGQQILVSAEGETILYEQQADEEAYGEAVANALGMLERWENAGLEIDLKAAAEVFKVDIGKLRLQWRRQDAEYDRQPISGRKRRAALAIEYYSRIDIQESFYSYAEGRCFGVAASKSHFRIEQPSDIPALAAYFESSDPNWRGFECTRAMYEPADNQIVACDIGIEIDFSRSDCVSAVELAQTLTAVLQNYEVFCFAKFDGNEILELVIPAEALPKQVDGRKTSLQMHQTASGLNRGFRRMPEVSGNDCVLIIQPYGYTRPAYSLNPETGLACIVFMPENLDGFSPESAEPDRVSLDKPWLDIPPDAPFQAQRFLKYALSPDWRPGAQAE